MRHATGSRVWSTDVWSVKVIVPPGFTPPASVAMSWIVWPAVAVAVALVVSVGVGRASGRGRAEISVVAVSLKKNGSPEYRALQRHAAPRTTVQPVHGQVPLPARSTLA